MLVLNWQGNIHMFCQLVGSLKLYSSLNIIARQTVRAAVAEAEEEEEDRSCSCLRIDLNLSPLFPCSTVYRRTTK